MKTQILVTAFILFFSLSTETTAHVGHIVENGYAHFQWFVLAMVISLIMLPRQTVHQRAKEVILKIVQCCLGKPSTREQRK